MEKKVVVVVVVVVADWASHSGFSIDYKYSYQLKLGNDGAGSIIIISLNQTNSFSFDNFKSN